MKDTAQIFILVDHVLNALEEVDNKFHKRSAVKNNSCILKGNVPVYKDHSLLSDE